MRRLLAAAALATLCATAAACGSDSEGSPSGSASTSTRTTAAGSSNTKQVCANAEKVITDSTTKFGQELSKIFASAATGNKSANDDAVKSIKKLFTEWADGLREQADKATDADLEAALNDTADQIAKVSASIKSTDDLQRADKLLDAPELEAASKKIESLCG